MIVDLDEFPDLALIIKAVTGVRYTNQSSGLACEHPQVEGFLVPLRTRAGRPELATLSGLFRGDWHALDAAQADSLDRALHRHNIRTVRVDRSMLAESREAWVHVIVSPIEEKAIPLAGGSSNELQAVLIWPNSD